MISKKLVHKLTVLSIVPVIISMVLFGSISYTIYKDQFVNQRMDEARSLVLLSSEEIENPLYFVQLDKLNAIIGNIKNNPNVITVFVMDAEGRVITDGTNENRFYGQIFTDNFSERSIKSRESIVVIENDVLRISSPVVINEKIGTIMIDFSLEELDTVLMDLLILLGAIGAIIVIVISTINLSISNSISKPVTELIHAVNEIAKGNFSARIEKISDDEIGELTGTFNKMAEDLQRSSDERKRAEEKLHLLSMAVEQSTEGIALVNLEGNILSINNAFAAMHGYKPEEVIGKNLSIFHNDEQMPSVEAVNRQVTETGDFNGEIWHIRRDGLVFPTWMHNSLLRDASGHTIGIIGTLRDITGRKLAEDTLKKLSSAVEQSGDSVIITDRKSNIEYVNRAFERLTGFSREEVIGMKPDFLMSGKHDRNFYYKLHDTITSGRVFGAEIINKKKNGELYISETTIMPIKDIRGNITHFVTTSKDITDRKYSENMRIENEHLALASKAKSEFLANMSHELRTPLNSIIGFSELIVMNTSLDNKQKHYIDNIRTSGKFLLNLINDILDLSKVEAGKIELVIDKINVPTVVGETLTLIKEKASKQNVNLNREFDPALSYIEADQQRLKQILFNLLSNAVKFSKPGGGTVTITTKKEGDMAKFSVSDTGIGIKDENIDKLFSAFEQLDSGITKNYGGTGLGLAITKKLVELHDGTITVESTYGEGSTFTFTLPLVSKKSGGTDRFL